MRGCRRALFVLLWSGYLSAQAPVGVDRVLYEGAVAAEAIALGIIEPGDWIGVPLCPVTLLLVTYRLEFNNAQHGAMREAGRSGGLKQQLKIVQGLLSPAQKAKYAAFQRRLALARTAYAAGHIERPSQSSEFLCP